MRRRISCICSTKAGPSLPSMGNEGKCQPNLSAHMSGFLLAGDGARKQAPGGSIKRQVERDVKAPWALARSYASDWLAHAHAERLIAQRLVQVDGGGVIAEDVEINAARAHRLHDRFERLHRRSSIALAAIRFVNADEVDEG